MVDDGTKKTSRSSSISSSSSGEEFFQFEISNLGTAAISFNSSTDSIKSQVPESINQLVLDKHVGLDGTDKSASKINGEIQSEKERRADDKFHGTLHSENPKATEACVSPAVRNSHCTTLNESANGDDVQLMLEETDDVPSEMTFKANHSALDYSYVSQLENNSNYIGFAKQSLVSQANAISEAYDPSRIPASVFGKPQSHMEWSAASNDGIQDKPQRVANAMAAPKTSTMPHPSESDSNSEGADGFKAAEAGHNANQVDLNNQGSWFSCSCLPCPFSS